MTASVLFVLPPNVVVEKLIVPSQIFSQIAVIIADCASVVETLSRKSGGHAV